MAAHVGSEAVQVCGLSFLASLALDEAHRDALAGYVELVRPAMAAHVGSRVAQHAGVRFLGRLAGGGGVTVAGGATPMDAHVQEPHANLFATALRVLALPGVVALGDDVAVRVLFANLARLLPSVPDMATAAAGVAGVAAVWGAVSLARTQCQWCPELETAIAVEEVRWCCGTVAAQTRCGRVSNVCALGVACACVSRACERLGGRRCGPRGWPL
jgi:hypothetical protein